MITLLQVALGGAIGASLRYGANLALKREAFPWHTLTVNVLGSALMAVLMVWLAHRGGMRFAPFLMTGVLGGFTTFSAFSLDTMALFERGQTGLASLYIASSVGLSLAAFALAATLTRSLLT